MNEAQTRNDLIDPALKKAGWRIVQGSNIHLEFPITQGRLIGKGKRKSAKRADYVLEYKNRLLAVIEAKPMDNYYTEGLSQAKSYAKMLDVRFAYATNGKQIYQVDRKLNTQGDVSEFPSPEKLWQMTFDTAKTKEEQKIQEWMERFRQIRFETIGKNWQPRYYQEVAIEKVLEAIAKGEKRILLNLATGTGKTAIAFQIVWKLFHSRWNLTQSDRQPRILFLADRNILANQAFNAFSAFDKEDENIKVRISPDEIRKKRKIPTNGSIFFSIFQTFMSNYHKDEDKEIEYKEIKFNFGEYEKDFFDLIIIDECHRGGANDESTWRKILEYFSPAVQLGLTATPKRDVNVDTYKYFGEPVYTYALKEGINDGFLTPFRVKKISSTIDDYEHTNDNEVLEGEVKQGESFKEKDFNSKIQIKEREKFRVKKFLEHINHKDKTLVFCKNQEHALLIRDFINENAKTKNNDYCQRVTADEGEQGEQYLKDFQDNEKIIPTVLTTSHKLSTGVDTPEVRNIVLLRTINSMIEFKQIIGRGTRLFEGKDYFTIYDFVKAFKNFNDPQWDGEPLEIIEIKEGDDIDTKAEKTCKKCNEAPCICKREKCLECNNEICTCEKPKSKMKEIKLSDGNYRNIDSMTETNFLDSSGNLISTNEFIKKLFADLPHFFTSEEELINKWSNPIERNKFLQSLSEAGYGKENLEDLRRLINAEHSDLFDVLNYIAHNKTPITRKKRVSNAKNNLPNYDKKQQEFINFVLKQYEKYGILQLDDKNLSDLIKLQYQDNTKAKEQLGNNKYIRELFIDFQKYLYKVA